MTDRKNKRIDTYWDDEYIHFYACNSSIGEVVPMSEAFFQRMLRLEELYEATDAYLKKKFRKYKAKRLNIHPKELE